MEQPSSVQEDGETTISSAALCRSTVQDTVICGALACQGRPGHCAPGQMSVFSKCFLSNVPCIAKSCIAPGPVADGDAQRERRHCWAARIAGHPVQSTH